MTSSAATSITTTTATLNGNVTSDGGSAVTERGFVYKTSAGATITDNKTTVSGTTGAYTLGLSSLGVNVQYFFKAYAINSIGTTLSTPELSFYTLANTPTAPTVGSPTSTTLNVTIGGSDGNPAITTYAIKEAGGQFVQASGALGASAVFQTASAWGTKTVTGLSPSTGYSFTVEAQNGNSVATSFGSAGPGTTSAGSTTPSVTTQAASILATTSATLNGTLTADGGASITERGFYWSMTPTVTTSSTKLTASGTAVGAFTASLGSLSANTIYYYRTYAINSVGTTLGSADVSFYTLANTPSAPTVNDATPNSLNVAITSGDGNPSTTSYAIQETTSGTYVQVNVIGGLGAVPIYKTAATWGTTLVTNLNANTTYNFAVVATNGAGTATGLSSTTSGTTQITPIAGWPGPWTGTTADPLTAPTKNANLSSAPLARVGLTATSSGARFSSSGWNTTVNYMTATLTAISGYVINLNSAALTGNWGSSSTGPASFDVRSSVDNYASSLGTISSSTGTAYTSLALPASGYNGLSSITFKFIGSATAAGGGSTTSGGTGGAANFYVSGSVGASTITGAATASAFTTTYGTASAPQTFPVSGANLIANLTATAPTGFEVSSDGTTYGATATFIQSGGSASGTLSVRLKATATVSGSYNSQNIVLSSTGASSVSVTTAPSGNTILAKGLTITGLTGSNKVYDGLTTAAFTGTAAYSGLTNNESFSVSGSPSASFTDAAVANGKTINVVGYTAPSANYSLTQPVLSANITAAALTVTANTAYKNFGGTLTFAGTEFSSSALQNNEGVTNVTLTSSGTDAGAANGAYSIVPSLPILGTNGFNTNNYAITYNNGTLFVYAFTTNAFLALSTPTNTPAQLLIAKVKFATTGGSNTLSLVSASGASSGSLTTNGTAITYTPTGSSPGTDTFYCVVQDGHGLTTTVQVNVMVTDPGNPATGVGNGSNLAIRSLGGGVMRVFVLGTAGTNYLLQFTSDFAGWTNYTPAFAMPPTGVTNFDDSSGVSPRYYRTALP